MVATSVTADQFSKAPLVAPRIEELGGELRFGRHNVVSPDGEKILWLIRSTVGADAGKREASLRALKDYASADAPEAVNFIGFVNEYGLFGTHKDADRARTLYAAAATTAKGRYQPALYNLGVTAAYGRATPVDFARAARLFEMAAAVAPDASARVCGLGSFVNFRRSEQPQALAIAKGCASPLASLAIAKSQPGALNPHTIEALRQSTATGIDDGLSLILQGGRAASASDGQYLYCKYLLVTRHRQINSASQTRGIEGLRGEAQACVDQTMQGAVQASNAPGADQMRRDQAVLGITGFVPAEIAALDAMRRSNHFHYSWSVPYLPFTQQDATLFEPLLSH
jgi:hypothetical protein